MRRTLTFALVAAAVLATPQLAAAQQSKTEQELLQIERDWCTADVKADTATLGRITSDDVSLVSEAGKLRNKTEWLAEIKAGGTTACAVDMMKVRVYGDTAIVTGRSTVSGVDEKKVAFKDRRFMWTDTFVRRDGRWLCVATQSSRIP